MTHGWLTTREVADALGVSPRRVRQLAQSRNIQGRKVGQSWLWPPRILARCKERKAGRPRKGA